MRLNGHLATLSVSANLASASASALASLASAALRLIALHSASALHLASATATASAQESICLTRRRRMGTYGDVWGSSYGDAYGGRVIHATSKACAASCTVAKVPMLMSEPLTPTRKCTL